MYRRNLQMGHFFVPCVWNENEETSQRVISKWTHGESCAVIVLGNIGEALQLNLFQCFKLNRKAVKRSILLQSSCGGLQNTCVTHLCLSVGARKEMSTASPSSPKKSLWGLSRLKLSAKHSALKVGFGGICPSASLCMHGKWPTM